MLVNYSDPVRGFPNTRITLHHNLWNRIVGRIPELSRENIPSAARSTLQIEISNNVVWDQRAAMWIALTSEIGGPDDGPPIFYELQMVRNYYVAQSGGLAFGMWSFGGGPDPEAQPENRFYLEGNRLSRWPGLADYQLVYCCNDFDAAALAQGMPYPDPAAPPAFSAASPLPFPPLTYSPGGEALVDALRADVGAFPRDPMDRRLLAPLATRTFDPADPSTNPADDALSLDFTVAPAPPPDADADGIPDGWETANGLDPTGAADASLTTLSVSKLGVDGYTNLEVYLHERAVALVGGG